MPVHMGLVSGPDITRLVNNVNMLTAIIDSEPLSWRHGPTSAALASSAEVRVNCHTAPGARLCPWLVSICTLPRHPCSLCLVTGVSNVACQAISSSPAQLTSARHAGLARVPVAQGACDQHGRSW